MKKLMRLVMTLVLCVTMMSITAFASGTGTISVSSDTAVAGETVVVTASITSNPGVFAMKVRPTYDSSVLTLESIVGSGLSWTIGNAPVGENSAMEDSTYTGTILTMTFTVNENAVVGTKTSVSLDVVEAYNYDVEDVTFSVAAGTVEIVKPAHDHVYEGKITTPATCEKEGVMTYTCTVIDCGDSYTEVIPKLGHAYGEGKVTTAATCTAEGVKTFVCANGCGVDKTETIAALGHDWDEGKVTTPATCKEKGVMTYTCKREACGTTKTEDIALAAHTPGTELVANDTHHYYECTVCGTAIESAEHSFEWIVDKKATATETGLKHEECSECHATRNENTEIPKVESLDDVPQTNDITGQIVVSIAAVLVVMAAAVTVVFRRRTIK